MSEETPINIDAIYTPIDVSVNVQEVSVDDQNQLTISPDVQEVAIEVMYQQVEVEVSGSGPSGPPGPSGGITTDDAEIDWALLFNGTEAVWAPQGTSFAFAIDSFSTNQSATQLIGAGEWQATGGITFAAQYHNDIIPESAIVTVDSNRWGVGTSADIVDGSASSPSATNYPASANDSITFTITANSIESSRAVTFVNQLCYGVTTKTADLGEGWDANDITGMTAILSNDHTRQWPSITAGPGERICLSWPARLTDPTFFIGGFEVTFEKINSTFLLQNAASYEELYVIFISSQDNLGATVVVTS